MNKRAVREGDNVRIKSLFIINFTLDFLFLLCIYFEKHIRVSLFDPVIRTVSPIQSIQSWTH